MPRCNDGQGGCIDYTAPQLAANAADIFEFYKRAPWLSYTPHEKQALFHRLGKICRARLFAGGNRTGKTKSGASEAAFHLTGKYPAWWEGAVFKNTVDAWAASNTSATTRDILQLEYLGDLNIKSKTGAIPKEFIIDTSSARGIPNAIDTAWIKHPAGVSTVAFKSYDQGREKFQGTKRKLIHLDEEPPADIYTECLMRIAGFDDEVGILMLTMTPLMGMTQLLQENYFSGDAKPGIPNERGNVFVQAGWEDNPTLTEQEREFLIKVTPSHELEARRKGVPALGSGMVYPVSEESYLIDPIDIPKSWGRVFGMDFGWTNPTAAVFIAYNRDDDTVYVVAEYYQSQLTPATHSANLQKMGADLMPGVCDPAGLQADKSDGQNLFNQYRRHGLDLTLADNSREAGIMKVLERLQQGRLKIFKTCQHLISEMRMYARDELGRPKKVNDHLLDGLRYAIVSGLGKSVNGYELSLDQDTYYGESDERNEITGY